jgi:imidazoleglycerol phosphate synthase glutamine amidotransferase subunit HisH
VAGTFVLDYGFCRPEAIVRALAATGEKAELTSNPSDVRHASRLIVPDGIDDPASLRRGVDRQALEAVEKHVQHGRPLLAVGTGMLLLTTGYRSKDAVLPGTNLFDTPVFAFDPGAVDTHDRPLQVPHLGFSYVVGLERHPALAEVTRGEKGGWFYFRHRLYAGARVPFADVAVAHHGIPFAGAIWRNAILATQFLPELSGPVGLSLLAGWCAMGSNDPP